MQEFIEKQWALCQEELSRTVTSIGMDLWLKPLQALNIDGDNLVIVAPHSMSKGNAENQYRPYILPVVQKIFNLSDYFVITADDKEEYIKEFNRTHPNEKGVALTNKPSTLSNPFNPRYTFENFVVGTTNQVIYAAARAVAETPATRFNPLFIYGGVGLGKTHLMHAIGNYIWEHKQGSINIVYCTCEQFTNAFVEAIRVRHEKGMDAFHKIYRQADILLIDDIQFIGNKKGVQEEFFNTFNDLYQAGKQIIITSDRPPQDIPTLEERLRSRFASGFIQDIQAPDFETRLLIIQKKIELEGYEFEKGMDYTLAERLSSYNIREIEAFLRKIYFYASLSGTSIATSENMEDVLSKSGNENNSIKSNKVTQEKIIDVVCQHYSIDRKDLTGRKRNKEIVEPRQICIYLMWSQLAIPLVTIGQIFNRDHTTIIHARDKIMELVKTNKSTKKIIADLTSKFKE